MPLSPDTDRRLIDLIATITDEGQAIGLALFAEHYGSERYARVIRDDIAVVWHVPNDKHFHGTLGRLRDAGEFLSQDDALLQVKGAESARDYVLSEGPWVPIALEDEPDLIFRYCADEPGALAEVRRRNKERREAWEQKRAGA